MIVITSHVDVPYSNSSTGEQLVVRSGEHELNRYLAMGEATGAYGGSSYWESGCDCIYHDKIDKLHSGDAIEPFGERVDIIRCSVVDSAHCYRLVLPYGGAATAWRRLLGLLACARPRQHH